MYAAMSVMSPAMTDKYPLGRCDRRDVLSKYTNQAGKEGILQRKLQPFGRGGILGGRRDK